MLFIRHRKLMLLYNIHSHKIGSEQAGYEVRTVLNTLPQDYASAKDALGTSYFSSGIHPWYAEEGEKSLTMLEHIIREEDVVAIGEIGLDKLRGPSIDIQLKMLEAQIKLAEEVQKPIIIHCVKAWDELIAIYKKRKSSVSWILHGYRGNPEQTKQLVKLGFKFSIGEKFNTDSIRLIPLDSIFCETDESDISVCQVYEALSNVLMVEKKQFDYLVAENIFKNVKLLTK